MKKFKFRLQKVLNFRIRLEELAEEAFLEARAARLNGELEIQRIKDARKELLYRNADTLSARRELELLLEKSDDDERAQAAVNRVLQEEEETARQQWLLAKQEAEALSKLREQSVDEWNLETTRFEQKALDEWAVQKKAA